MNSPTERAIERIRRARRIAALSGAGISTEAGIPDFRGPGGLWENPALMRLMSASGFRRDPGGFYRAAVGLFPKLNQARPTDAHRLLARLEEEGRVTGVVTQNIDGLHQAAGSRRVFEIHGTFRSGHCIRCSAAYDMTPVFEEVATGGPVPPRCGSCGSPIKPDVVLFEDIPPEDVFENATRAVSSCDLLLVLGSSLVVYPAAYLPHVALDNGAAVVIVNMEDTDFDPLASVVVRGSLGDFARAALAAL